MDPPASLATEPRIYTNTTVNVGTPKRDGASPVRDWILPVSVGDMSVNLDLRGALELSLQLKLALRNMV